MIKVLLHALRVLTVLCVVFCCTARPALAQPSQTFSLNGVSADVIAPQAPVRVGDTFWISVEVRPHGNIPPGEFHVVLDGRPLGRRDGIDLPDGIADGIPNNREWFEPASLYATLGDVVVRITVSDAAGRGGVIEVPLRLLPAADADADTLPDPWELRFGLSTESVAGDDGPDGDPDGDGVRNRDEYLHNTHPRGFHRRYFAEGVSDNFFDTSVTPVHLPGERGRMHIRMVDGEGWATSMTEGVDALGNNLWASPSYESRRQLGSSFSTIVESEAPFTAERWTTWPSYRSGVAQGYGSHASEGVASLSTRWLFAEGVTGGFYTYVALLNPSPQTARLTVTYFGVDGATPVVREHIVAPDSRATIFVNADAAGLTSPDLSIVIDSDVPIAAERSIYRHVGSAFWGAGTSSAGTPSPSTQWFFAEGLVNPAFDTYLVLLNAETTAATIEVSVLRADGPPITLTHTIAPRSRATLRMNSADPALASSAASFGLVVRSSNGTPIVAERTMWWNDPVRGTPWVEGHTSMGAREPATRWLAGQTMLANATGDAAVFLLLANPNATPATVRVTLPPAFMHAPTGEVTLTVPAYGRATLDAGATFVWALGHSPDGRRSALLVESIGDAPVPIVAERSVYANTPDTIWELGSNMLLTPLPPSTVTP